jgi:hypothetical protein
MAKTRIVIQVDSEWLALIDAAAKESYLSRSAFMALAAKEKAEIPRPDIVATSGMSISPLKGIPPHTGPIAPPMPKLLSRAEVTTMFKKGGKQK